MKFNLCRFLILLGLIVASWFSLEQNCRPDEVHSSGGKLVFHSTTVLFQRKSTCYNELFKTQITYLGHIVSKGGLGTDQKKVAAIANWHQPTMVTVVWSFLGFTNHYRRVIHKYALMARPLNLVTTGDHTNKKKQIVQWNEDCKVSFQKLKQLCSSTPILTYANYNKPFKLPTDTFWLGLGAVLYQSDDNSVDRVIAYASWALSKSERNYPTHKLELLALKWIVTDQFHEYLCGIWGI